MLNDVHTHTYSRTRAHARAHTHTHTHTQTHMCIPFTLQISKKHFWRAEVQLTPGTWVVERNARDASACDHERANAALSISLARYTMNGRQRYPTWYMSVDAGQTLFLSSRYPYTDCTAGTATSARIVWHTSSMLHSRFDANTNTWTRSPHPIKLRLTLYTPHPPFLFQHHRRSRMSGIRNTDSSR